MEVDTFVQHEAIRSEIYKLLADCYYPPDETLSGNVIDLDQKLGMVCPQARQDDDWCGEKTFKADHIKELMVDHARLFVGPFTLLAPPYGSVYLDTERRIMGDSTMAVADRYREAGLEMARDFKDVPDHVTVELEFMHFLISRAIEAATNNKFEAIRTYFQKQRSFLEYHLCAWITEFTKNIVNHAQSAFYKSLAKTTKTFLDDDYKHISAAVCFEQHESEKAVEINSLQV
jgi:TorA maturation chaperone TorD